QGPWPKTLPPTGRPVIRYRLAREAKNLVRPLPANSQSVLEGMSLPVNFAERLVPKSVQDIFYANGAGGSERGKVLQTLIAVRKSRPALTQATTPDPVLHFDLMDERLNRALARASGISSMLLMSNNVLIPGTTMKASLNITNHGESAARIESLNLRGLQPAGKPGLPKTLAPGERLTIELQNSTPRTAAITVPAAEHLYDGRLFGEELGAGVNVSIDGASFPVWARAEVPVAPAVEIVSVTPSPLVLSPASMKLAKQEGESGLTGAADTGPNTTFTLRLVNHQDRTFTGKLIFGGLNAKGAAQSQELKLAAKEELNLSVKRSANFALMNLDAQRSRATPNVITVSVVGPDGSSPVTQRSVKVVWADARVAPNLRVGYVPSFDETLKHSLAALGVEARELTLDDARAGDLTPYQTIIIDNRGYQAHPELIAANSHLMDFVRDGGTLIVFYHKTNEWNPDPRAGRPQLAPYPIVLGGSRVTDENAAVEFTEPQSPLLNYPNRITAADFQGWVQERGLYYPQTWDQHYSAPLSMSDAGEPPLRGGLLIADYGRGHYIYTSMVWYRQLRAGLPGAYRVLANMISYGRKENGN
ncbi:MAG TPA: hypothetical protein VEV81_15440, partial [Pyrinomonadaceae bacterium]|nr:hypothetical protein [Pyrinomonadaceae bacterium]